MSRRIPAALAAFSFLTFAPLAAQQPGALDTTFSGDGVVLVDVQVNSQSRNNSATHVLVQADGKVVLAGAAQNPGACNPSTDDCTERMVAVRLNATGVLDGGFGSGGIVRVDGLNGRTDEGYYDGRIGFAPDGDVYLFSGTLDEDTDETIGWAAARLNSANGSLDSGWGGDGRVDESTSGIAGDVAVTAAGEVLILDDFLSGSQQMRVCRYTSTGGLDAGFGDAGCRTVAFDLGTQKDDWSRVMIVAPDGRIVVAGGAQGSATNTDFAIAVLTAGGDLDDTFSSDGKATLDFGLAAGSREEVRALAVDAEGRIYAGGLAGAGESGSVNDCALARFLPNGTPDPAFGGGDGKVNFDYTGGSGTFEQIFGMAVQGDGRVVVAGRGSNGGAGRRVGVARLTATGALDATFGGGDGAAIFNFGSAGNTVGRSLALQDDGRIVVSGYARSSDNDFFAARLHNDYVFASGFEDDFAAWGTVAP